MRREKLSKKSFNELLADLNDEIENKITSLGPSDCVNFPISYRSFPSLEEYDSKIEDFFKRFEYKSPYGETSFYYENVKQSFENYLDPLSHESLHNFVEKYCNMLEMKRKILHERINTPFILENHFLEFNNYEKKLMQEEMVTQTLLLKLSQKDSKLLENEKQFLKEIEQNYHLQFFPLESFYDVFLLFTLTRKKEIVSLAISRLDQDDEKYQNYNFPSFPTTSEEIVKRLKTLSSELGIDFDIELHDGHHFFYSCDKSFSDVFRSHIIAGSIDPPPSVIKNPSLQEIIQTITYDNMKSDMTIARKLADISSTNPDEISEILSDVRFEIRKKIDVQDEILACWQKLSYIRNRRLLYDIIEILHEINDLRHKIHRLEIPSRNAPSIPGFAVFRRQLIFNMTEARNINQNLDVDLILQECLLSEMKFLTSKKKLMEVLYEISLHTTSNDVLEVCDEIFSLRPDNSFFLEGTHKHFDRSYDLEASKCDLIANIFSILISMQKSHLKMNGKSEFNGIFSIMTELSILPMFFKAERGMKFEICNTMLMRAEKYKEYINYGIWRSLLNLIKSYQGDLFYPFDFLQTDFNIPGYEGCADTFEAQISYHAMQKEIMKTKVLLPYYNTQASQFSMQTLETLTKPSHREQHILNVRLEAAIRYNNYGMEGEFNKSFNKDYIFYYYLPSTNLFASYEDDVILTSMRSDLAFLMTMEMIFLCQNGKQRSLKPGKFFNGEIIDPFAILSLDDCLSMKADEKIMKIALIKTRFLFLSRFLYSSTQRHEKVFEQIKSDNFSNQSSLIPQIVQEYQNEKKDVDTALIFLQDMENLELLKIILTILIPSIDQIEKPKVQVEKIIGRRPNTKNGSIEGPIRELFESIVTFPHYEKQFITMSRFIPLWIIQMMFCLGDNARTFFQEGSKNLDDLINDATINAKNKTNKEKIEYLSTLFNSQMLRLCYFEISSGLEEEDLDILTVFLNYKEQIFQKGQFFAEKLTKTTSLPKIEGDMTKIKENEFEIIKYKTFIKGVLREKQKNEVKSLFDKMTDDYQKSLNLGSPSFRPEIYSKAISQSDIKKSVYYLPDPSDLMHQFTLEKNYNICKLISKASDCATASKSSTNEINHEKLRNILLPLSQRIYDIFDKSMERFSQTWPSTLRSGLNIYESNMDDVLRSDCYLRKLSRDYDDQIKIKISDEMSEKFYLLNNLLATLKQTKSENKHFERQMTEDTQFYYNKVWNDLREEIENRKKNFGNVHDEFFSAALDTLTDLLTGEERVHQVVKEHKFKEKPSDPIKAVKEEIDSLKEEVVKMRIGNCIRQIGMKKVFEKKRDILVDDRRQYNSLLWGGKHRLDESLHLLQTELLEGEKKLSNFEMTIEDLQKEIKTIAHENAMLSHIREMLSLKTRDLNEDLEPLVDVDEDELCEILSKLEKANLELDEMKEEHDQYEEQVNIQVREPIAALDRMRRKLVTAKSQSVRADRLSSPPSPRQKSARQPSPRQGSPINSDYDDEDDEMTIVERQFLENKELKKENEDLKQKIEFIKTQLLPQPVAPPNSALGVPRLKIPKTANDLYSRLNAPKTAKRSARSRKIVKPQAYPNTAKSARN
ncbi:hypothetical protein TVAG_420440 [Trichomonas vaginalis G3]|uniref:Uncharacterized protein n=1 Tax=Trichomonas vaginalis (strain ATCC PRA-98 / G3) TaxID=412133 RepID=A2ED67_TRIV3|nr:coiled-coil domain-containing protein 162 family [Trichomonas vaginalis G3]EAY09422.1 hypothetical protein TVAG_420440 [Trichomonas vaginalis G3]KAI5536343.1 coiled-coil domain-containing protein 162 family [Trichomonas vaginalis G3]|eukprot:XP_001321645.1 hypothetical protein [Trichomonas vaginalis G3]